MTAAFALTSIAAYGTTIVVNSLADPGAAGICALRDAIIAANTMTATNGCAAGTGNDTIQFSVTGTISVASTLPQVTDSNLTINGPASPGITIDGGNAVQVMQVASGATVNLKNLTITQGFNPTGGGGGGIFNEGTLTVTNSTFSGNSTIPSAIGLGSGGGGGIYSSGGTLSITNSTFSGNSVLDRFEPFADGGGIYFSGGTLTVTNSTFSGNGASGESGVDAGGGIYFSGGTLTVTNSIFSGNYAIHGPEDRGGAGGGIYFGGRTLTITNSTFTNNDADSAGGGIDSSGGTLTVTNSTFSGNTGFGGGGIFNEGTLIVTNSTFSGNNAVLRGDGEGGGIANRGTLTVTNSTFSGNSAGSGLFGAGGGIDSSGGTLSVTNSTFSGNSALHGGGISGAADIKNTIVAGSTNPWGGFTDNCGGTITDLGYNISDDDSCGFTATGSLNNTDPELSSDGLTNNGGPTQTIALLSGSPAIDAIPVANCSDQASRPNPLITDQRLFPRPDSEEDLCDIGAYEFQDTPFVPFTRFSGSLTIDSNTRVLNLSGRFNLGPGGSIDPSTQPVAFSEGQHALRLGVGSFVENTSGYVFQTRFGKSILRVTIKFTNTPGSYRLLVFQKGGPQFTSPVPVTLTIGDDSGSTQMKAKLQ